MQPIVSNLIILAVLISVVFLIARYLHRQKKSGAACIGCPYAGKCRGGCGRPEYQ